MEFFARLTGRRRSAQEAVPELTSDPPDPILSLLPPLSEQGDVVDAGGVHTNSSSAAGDEHEADNNVVQVSVVEADPELAVIGAPSLGANPDRQKPPMRGTKRGQPALRRETPRVAEAASLRPVVSERSNADVLILDHKIQDLRRQLAIKLQAQNAQLRKMLARFGD